MGGFGDLLGEALPGLDPHLRKGLNDAGQGAGIGLKFGVHGLEIAQNGLMDLLFPGIPRMTRKVNSQIHRYNAVRKQLSADTKTFQARLASYQTMVAYNSALLITLSVLKMSDAQFAGFQEQVDKNAPDITLTSLPIQIADSAKEISQLVGGVFIIKAIRTIHKLTTDSGLTGDELGELDINNLAADAVESGVSEAAEGAADVAAEVIAEATVDVAAAAGLAETGVGILVAAGIFVIGSVVEGFEEEKKLKEAIDKMTHVLDQVDGYLHKVDTALQKANEGIHREETRFLAIMQKLTAIQPAPFRWQYNVSPSTAGSFAGAMLDATGQYGFINKARIDWSNTQQSSPDINWELFVDMELRLRNPKRITAAEAEQFLQLVKQYSESMQQAEQRGTLKTGDQIFLRSTHWQQQEKPSYVSARPAAEDYAVSLKFRPLAWEHWQLVSPNGDSAPLAYGDTVALESVQWTGRYLKALGSGDQAPVDTTPESSKDVILDEACLWTFVPLQAQSGDQKTLSAGKPLFLQSKKYPTLYLSARDDGTVKLSDNHLSWEQISLHFIS